MYFIVVERFFVVLFVQKNVFVLNFLVCKMLGIRLGLHYLLSCVIWIPGQR